MNRRDTINPKWLAIAYRLEQLARSGNGKNARITATILVDESSLPRYMEFDRCQIEPKSADLSFLLSLLPDEGRV